MFTRFAKRASLLSAHPFAAVLATLLFATWLGAISAGQPHLATMIAEASAVGTVTIVFLLQHAQYHDTRALHAKLDELILSLDGPRDVLAGVERRATQELDELRKDPDLEDELDDPATDPAAVSILSR